MYDDHYGLSGRPFQLTPDPKFWFDTASHKKAMAYLGYGLSQGEGFIVITGEPGVGKTTLLGHLIETLDRERLTVIKIVTTQVDAEDLLVMVAAGLGIDGGGMVKAQLLAAIERGLHASARAGKRTLLIVDEAQALPLASLEELRMLSNFQAGGYALLQIFLLGQPEFRRVLQGSERLEQLRQRVIAMHQLDPMDVEEVEPYVIHRLSVVGWRGRPRFKNDAIAALHRWSAGNPRLVNQLAGRVMLYGAIEQIDTFTGDDLARVIADIDSDTPGHGESTVEAAVQPPVAEPESASDAAGPPAGEQGLPPAAPPPVMVDPGLVARMAAMEAQLQEQDAALRRVLSLLVEWVEKDGTAKPNVSPLRGTAA